MSLRVVFSKMKIVIVFAGLVISVLGTRCASPLSHYLIIYGSENYYSRDTISEYKYCYVKNDTFYHVFPTAQFTKSIVLYDTVVADSDTTFYVKDIYTEVLPVVNSYGPFWSSERGGVVSINTASVKGDILTAEFWKFNKKVSYPFPKLYTNVFVDKIRSDQLCAYSGKDTTIILANQALKCKVFMQAVDENFLDGHTQHRVVQQFVSTELGQSIGEERLDFDQETGELVPVRLYANTIVDCETQDCDSILNLMPTLGMYDMILPWNDGEPERLLLRDSLGGVGN
jgi:hypothetical protein